MADVSVVVVDLTGDASRATDSVRAAAARAGADVEVVAVGNGREPSTKGDKTLAALALGVPYLRNRGLDAVSAPVVAFLDGDLAVGVDWIEAVLDEPLGVRASAVAGLVSRGAFSAGSLARIWPGLRGAAALVSPLWLAGAANAAFARERLLAVGGFGYELRRGGEAEIFRRLARAGDAVAWSRHMAASGRRRTPVAAATPTELLAGVPPSIAGLLTAEPQPFARSHPAKTHFLYTAGSDLLLHLHANPSPRVERAVSEREEIRRRAAVGGIPALVTAATAPDALWLLEERLPGRPPEPLAADAWFDAAADWAVGMAGPPGPRLAEVATWVEHQAALLAFAPEDVVDRVDRALAAVSTLRAVHMHGDLQPRNLLLHNGAFGAVDWEGAWLEGLPGLDLVFLAMFAVDGGPDVGVLELLARGEDVPRRQLLPRLRRLGVERELLPDLVVAMLAVWALSEHRRLTRLGTPPRPPVFAPLLRRFSAET